MDIQGFLFKEVKNTYTVSPLCLISYNIINDLNLVEMQIKNFSSKKITVMDIQLSKC